MHLYRKGFDTFTVITSRDLFNKLASFLVCLFSGTRRAICFIFLIALFSVDNILFKSEEVSIDLFLDMFLSILFSDVGVFSLTDEALSFGNFSVSTLELRISRLEPPISFSLDTRFSFPFSDCDFSLLDVSNASFSFSEDVVLDVGIF